MIYNRKVLYRGTRSVRFASLVNYLIARSYHASFGKHQGGVLTAEWEEPWELICVERIACFVQLLYPVQ